MTSRPRIVLAAALLLGAAACVDPEAVLVPLGSEPASDDAAPDPAPRPAPAPEEPDPPAKDPLGGFVPEPIAWSVCPRARTVRCATVSVPLDWTAPSGARIDLALTMAPASGERIGSLILNPGGPGAAGRAMAFSPPVSDEVSERFDIVGFDPRGVGVSAPLSCGSTAEEFWSEDPSPDTVEEAARLDDAAMAVAEECARTDGDLIANMGTDSVARDLEAIRLALGGEPLNYMGFSYGTLIGLRYLDLFAANAATMVLDGVVDPTQSMTEWLSGQTVALDDAISRIFSTCEASSRCPLDDPVETYDALAAAVETRPLDGGLAVGPDRLGPAELATAAVLATYSPSFATPFIKALAAARDGDPDPMLQLALRYYSFGGFASYVAVVCSDSAHPVGAAAWRSFADELEALSPRFGASVANELLPCAFWGAPARPITAAVAAPDAPPVLVLGNRGDAATPYENSVAVADMLATGVLVSFDGKGHTSYGESECVGSVVDRYLVERTVPTSDPDC